MLYYVRTKVDKLRQLSWFQHNIRTNLCQCFGRVSQNKLATSAICFTPASSKYIGKIYMTITKSMQVKVILKVMKHLKKTQLQRD